MTDFIFLTLLYVHIVFVVAWLGTTLFGGLFLLPVMPKLSPQGRSDFSRLIVPGSLRFALIAGTIALVDGVLLYSYINVFTTANATSAEGLPYIQTGALIGFLTLAVGTMLQMRTAREIQRVSSQLQQGPEAAGVAGSGVSAGSQMQVMAKLQSRAKTTALLGAALLLIVIALMVAGANL